MFTKVTKTNADVSKKTYSLRVTDVKNIVTTSIFFLKVEFEGELRISESNSLFVIPYIKLGHHQVLTTFFLV